MPLPRIHREAAIPHDDLAPFIDQACLRPEAGGEDLARACREAREFGFRGLCVASSNVARAARLLDGSGTKVVSTVAFPHGNALPDVKAFEARRALERGAQEIDYVIHLGAAADGDYRYLREEAVAILRTARTHIVKAILEVGLLDEERIFRCADTLAEAGVPYVKTCTGFAEGAATEELVQTLARAVTGRALIKASGGIRERYQAIQLLAAGAAVIGTSRGPQICSEAPAG